MIVRPESAAFPYLDGENELSIAEVGLTKRELFAAMVLQGILANRAIEGEHKEFADDAVELADWLIEKLNQRSDVRE